MSGERSEATRRRVLKTGGLVTAWTATLAGCVGGDGGGGDGGDGGDGGGDGDGGGSTPTATATPGMEFPEFDPANPEYPQPAPLLLEHNFHRGTGELLETMRERERDEPRYGNDVPETPSDASEQLDPDPLIVTIGAGEARKAKYEDALGPLMDNIEKETGRSVEFTLINSVASKIEGMRSDRIHIANFGTGELPFAVNIAGAYPFAIPISKLDDGSKLFGYAGWLITQIDNPNINSVPDLKGQGQTDDRPRPVAHSSRDSNSGNQAPRALFMNDYNIVPGEDYKLEFSGSHENSIRGVILGDYAAAPDAATNIHRLTEADEIDPSTLKVCWRAVFPSGPNCMHYKLTPELQEGIKRAHYDYDYSDSGLNTADIPIDGGNFVPMEYKTFFDTILKIHKVNGYEYNTGALG